MVGSDRSECCEVKKYHQLLNQILLWGEDRPDRTGVGTRSVFGAQAKFDLTVGFPLVTTKKMFWKGIVHELLWFLHPTQNLDYLHEHNVHIWDEWAREGGEVGPIYGTQWRKWALYDTPDAKTWAGTYDQLQVIINQIKRDPYSRRHFVSAWNVQDLSRMALEPCHVSFQFYVTKAGWLHCHMYQRSADAFLGVPFNIASYALLTHMVAQVTGYQPGILTISYGDLHLYQNHLDLAREQLCREPYPLPNLALSPDIKDIDLFKFEDCVLLGYHSHPAISAPIAV